MNKFLFMVEAPAASFSREFATIKSLSQYKRRNPNLQGVEYTLHDGAWVRFVIHGSQIIPEPVLRSLLNSLNSPSPLSCGEGPGERSMKPQSPHPQKTIIAP